MNRIERRQLTVQIFNLLGNNKTIAEISDKLSKPVTTVYHICKKLVISGHVNKSDNGFQIVKPLVDIEAALGHSKIGEIKAIKCMACEVIQNRKFLDRINNKNIYVGDDGSRWEGKKCPDCFRASFRTEDLRKEEMTKRCCKDCKKPLPLSRYFKCYTCQPELDAIDEDYMFHGTIPDTEDDIYGYTED